jgi:phosphatidylglycerophosphatase A
MTSREPALITLFGLGHLRPAPGTWGSLPPIIVGVLMLSLGIRPEGGVWYLASWAVWHTVLLAVLIAATLACAIQGDRAEARFGSKDPSEAVADETAGQCLPLLFLPAAALNTPLLIAFTLLFTFVSFRVFDIFKPWPARELQRVPGGWGIVLDDLVAGLYAAAVVQVAARLTL